MNRDPFIYAFQLTKASHSACAAGIVKTILQSQIFDEPDPYRYASTVSPWKRE